MDVEEFLNSPNPPVVIATLLGLINDMQSELAIQRYELERLKAELIALERKTRSVGSPSDAKYVSMNEKYVSINEHEISELRKTKNPYLNGLQVQGIDGLQKRIQKIWDRERYGNPPDYRKPDSV